MKHLSLLSIVLLACFFAWRPWQTSIAEESLPAAKTSLATEIETEIETVLTRQAEHWNAGDIEGFMETYWKSDDLTFSSGGTTRRGWQKTLDRYQHRYPTPERMGQLTFSELETRPLGDQAALVLGRWHLEREGDPIGGNFTLVVEKLGGSWLIVHDHTSQLDE